MMTWPPILQREKRAGNRPGLGPLGFCRRSFLQKTMFWAAGVWTAGCARPWATGSALLPVKTADEFRRALMKAEPGTVIEAADGDYAFDESPLLVSAQGVESRPIVVRARNRGKARLTGKFGLHLRGAAHLLIEGFDFRTRTDHLETVGEIGWAAIDYEIRGFPRKPSLYSVLSAVLIEDSSFVRISRNRFRLNETGADRERYVNWLNITGPGSQYNRVDHNLFEEKFQSGVFVATSGGSRLNRIDHNYFLNTASFLETDQNIEVTAIALRRSHLGSPAGVVDHNLFEHCDGDSEIIEIKGGDNRILYNTFRNCQGGVSLRSGHRSLVEGNFFLNPSGRPYAAGVRIHGYDQKILNNYFEGLTGYPNRSAGAPLRITPLVYAPISMIGGDTELELGLQGGDYRRIHNAVIAFNTFVECVGPVFFIHIDHKRPLEPRDTVIANNVVIGSTGALVSQVGEVRGIHWAGNILYHSGGVEKLGIPADGSSVRFVDPRLECLDGICRPAQDSPLIGAALPAASVRLDIDGQRRGDLPDVGCDQWSSDRPRRPLLPEDVSSDSRGDEPMPVDWPPAAPVARKVNSNHRIQKFEGDGRLLDHWGREGVGPVEFSVPLALALDASGAIYVAEYGNERVQKLSPAGEQISQWGGIGHGVGEFSGPSGIAVGPEGDVWVLDKFNYRVQRFDHSGRYLSHWGSRGQARDQFDHPAALAVDRKGDVYILDPTHCRVQKFTPEGDLLTLWGGCGSRKGEFHYPVGITVDGIGNVYVADTLNHRIQKFSPQGRWVADWGGPGMEDGTFDGPAGVALDDRSRVYVVDSGNNRIQVFDADGSYLSQWGGTGSGPGRFRSPVGIAVGPDGAVYVSEVYRDRGSLE